MIEIFPNIQYRSRFQYTSRTFPQKLYYKPRHFLPSSTLLKKNNNTIKTFSQNMLNESSQLEATIRSRSVHATLQPRETTPCMTKTFTVMTHRPKLTHWPCLTSSASRLWQRLRENGL